MDDDRYVPIGSPIVSAVVPTILITAIFASLCMTASWMIYTAVFDGFEEMTSLDMLVAYFGNVLPTSLAFAAFMTMLLISVVLAPIAAGLGGKIEATIGRRIFLGLSIAASLGCVYWFSQSLPWSRDKLSPIGEVGALGLFCVGIIAPLLFRRSVLIRRAEWL